MARWINAEGDAVYRVRLAFIRPDGTKYSNFYGPYSSKGASGWVLAYMLKRERWRIMDEKPVAQLDPELTGVETIQGTWLKT